MIEDDLDRLVFLDDFGVDVEVETPSGRVSTLRAIFRNPTVEDIVGDTTVQNVETEILARTSDLVDLGESDTLTIGGATYRPVAPPMDDGTGMGRVSLRAL